LEQLSRKNRGTLLSHLKGVDVYYIDMDIHRHKTQKKPVNETDNPPTDDKFKNLLEDSAREAYSRPWHRIERGLRLNRLRIFVEEIGPQYDMTKEDKEAFFNFLQKALDKKLLNTLKVVIYDQETQRITTIRGLEIKRTTEGVLKWGFSQKKVRTDGTRKKKRDDIPSVSTQIGGEGDAQSE
jgi:hypothetical protein